MLFFLLFFVDGVLPQLQMVMFGGRIPLASFFVKVIIICVLCTAVLFHVYRKGTVRWPKVTRWPYFLFLIFLVGHFCLSLGEYPASYLLLSYNAYYMFLFLLPFTTYLEFSSRQFTRLMLVVSIPLIGIGFAQYFLGSPLLPTSSNDGYFYVLAWEYYENVRSFSLFSSGLQYGYFLSFLAPILVFFCWKTVGVNRFFSFIGLVILSFACFTTFTRNIYIQFTFSVTTAMLLLALSRRSGASAYQNGLPLLPFIYGLIATATVFLGQLFRLASAKDSIILQDESLLIRFVNWEKYYRLITESGLQKLLFGVGLISGSRVFIEDEVMIDNSFLAVALHIGLVGLLLWFLIMWRLWKWLLHISRIDKNNAAVFAITSYWSTWISGQLFNSGLNIYPLLAMVALPLYLAGRSGRSPVFTKSGHSLQVQCLLKPAPAREISS